MNKYLHNRSPKPHARLMASLAHEERERLRKEWLAIVAAYDLAAALAPKPQPQLSTSYKLARIKQIDFELSLAPNGNLSQEREKLFRSLPGSVRRGLQRGKVAA